MADGGYDVADYRAIEPTFGTLADAEALIREALDLGIRTIVDIVPNHVSDRHAWFQQALAAGPGSPLRDRFWFRPGRGPAAIDRPTGGRRTSATSAWTRTTNPDGTPGDWYLHLFAPGQPDLNWDHPDVRREHEDVLRFWFDRGAAGVRIDSAALAVKDPDAPRGRPRRTAPGAHPYLDRDELHDVYRSWRAPRRRRTTRHRVLIGEVWLEDHDRFARYLRPDELHTAFNFDFLACPWDPAALRRSIVATLDGPRPGRRPGDVGALEPRRHTRRHPLRPRRHVVLLRRQAHRHADRPRRSVAAGPAPRRCWRWRCPGSFYLYQGEELGLPEVDDIPADRIQDPMHFQSGGVDPGRDGCRVPLPWSGTAPPYGFSPAGASAEPWLPQPADWAELTAAAQHRHPGSMLELYRRAIATAPRPPRRRAATSSGSTPPPHVLAFRRGDVVCVVNLGAEPVALPVAGAGPRRQRRRSSTAGCPTDATAWIHAPTAPGLPTARVQHTTRSTRDEHDPAASPSPLAADGDGPRRDPRRRRVWRR